MALRSKVKMVPPQYKKGGLHGTPMEKPKAKVITKEDLNASGCATPNCGHDHSVLYLHGGCHISAATTVRYEKVIETLIIDCAKCGKEITRIKL
jgi:hypothetical protein